VAPIYNVPGEQLLARQQLLAKILDIILPHYKIIFARKQLLLRYCCHRMISLYIFFLYEQIKEIIRYLTIPQGNLVDSRGQPIRLVYQLLVSSTFLSE
jgi:hypothetical protein